MATRGRKPKPEALKKLEGRRGHRKRAGPEPAIAAGAPACPEDLDDVARAEWARVAPQLVELGVLTDLDRAALVGYCRAWSLFITSNEKVKTEGTMLVSIKNGVIYQSPHVSLMQSALKQMRDFAAELGMTPASRPRVRPDKPVADPLEAFTAGRGAKK